MASSQSRTESVELGPLIKPLVLMKEMTAASPDQAPSTTELGLGLARLPVHVRGDGRSRRGRDSQTVPALRARMRPTGPSVTQRSSVSTRSWRTSFLSQLVSSMPGEQGAGLQHCCSTTTQCNATRYATTVLLIGLRYYCWYQLCCKKCYAPC